MKTTLRIATLVFAASPMALTPPAQARTGPRPMADACAEMTDDALTSCRAGASSDYWLALGICANDARSSEQRRCQEQASEDQTDALATCGAQRDARQAVCRRLGGAPYDPPIDSGQFVAAVDNPYFPLRPGTTLVYEGRTPDGVERDTFSVTRNTPVIAGVTCVEVHDTVTVDGALVEDTLDWFAQDRDGNVWYFGENAKEIADGLTVGVEGSWTAGVDGARPGIIMKAHPGVGDFYRQEFLLGTAEDVGAVVGVNASANVPYGSFDGCVETEDTSPLEPGGVEHKLYAPGIGVVLELDASTGERLELIQVTID